MTETVLKKALIRLDLKFGNITPENAQIKQYELEKDLKVWRVFLNGYAKNGFVVFDGEATSKDEVMDILKDLAPEVKAMRRLTVADRVEESMSWNGVLEKMKPRRSAQRRSIRAFPFLSSLSSLKLTIPLKELRSRMFLPALRSNLSLTAGVAGSERLYS